MKRYHTKSRDIAAFIDYACKFSSRTCLFWPFGKNSAGYGHFTRNGKHVLAHRIVCERVHGPAPEGKPESAHTCGNGHAGCVNPLHLEWKDRFGNARDMVEHGRSQRGAKHYLAKLTEDDVRFIRANARTTPVQRLADKLGVSRGVVYHVLRGSSWGWVQ